MKLKIEERTTREIDVEFPIYKKGLYVTYKIVDENTSIKVFDMSEGDSYGIFKYKLVTDDCYSLQDSTEEEFNASYDKVTNAIINHQ